jgi:hypothetical protein
VLSKNKYYFLYHLGYRPILDAFKDMAIPHNKKCNNTVGDIEVYTLSYLYDLYFTDVRKYII